MVEIIIEGIFFLFWFWSSSYINIHEEIQRELVCEEEKKKLGIGGPSWSS